MKWGHGLHSIIIRSCWLWEEAAIREGSSRQCSIVVQSIVLAGGIMPPRVPAGGTWIHTVPSMAQYLKGSVKPLLISEGTKLKREFKKNVPNFSFGVDLLKNEVLVFFLKSPGRGRLQSQTKYIPKKCDEQKHSFFDKLSLCTRKAADLLNDKVWSTQVLDDKK